MELQISKWGNSLALRLPSSVVQQLGLRDGLTVQAEVTAQGALSVRPSGWNRKAFGADLDKARAALPPGTSVMEEVRREEVRRGERY